MHARNAFVADQVRAHLVEQAKMRALAHQVIVGGAQDRTERVGVGQPPVARRVARVKAQRFALHCVHRSLKEARVMAAAQLAQGTPVQRMGGHELGMGNKGARLKSARGFLKPEHREGIGVPPFHKGFHLRAGNAMGVGQGQRSGRWLHARTFPLVARVHALQTMAGGPADQMRRASRKGGAA